MDRGSPNISVSLEANPVRRNRRDSAALCPQSSSTPAPFLPGSRTPKLVPVRIDHHVEIVITLRNAVQAECQATRIVGQIDRGTRLRTMPRPPARICCGSARDVLFRNAIILLKNRKISPLVWSCFQSSHPFRCPGCKDCYCRIACSGIRPLLGTSGFHSTETADSRNSSPASVAKPVPQLEPLRRLHARSSSCSCHSCRPGSLDHWPSCAF